VDSFLGLLASIVLASAAWPLWRLWRATRLSALRSAAAWSSFALANWGLLAVCAAFEPQAGAWTWLRFWRLGATVLLAAPPVAVLGARRPGDRAWNLIVLSLLVVFALPGLEQWLLDRSLDPNRAIMDRPRTVFFCLVVLVGVGNYLPTRFGVAALVLAAGLAVEVASVGPWPVSAPASQSLTSLAGVLLGLGAWTAWLMRRPTPLGLVGAWLWLRDGWGVVWAIRFRDRWNAAAQFHGWPVRLTWRGFDPPDWSTVGDGSCAEAAEGQFRTLLRRFADPDHVLGPPSS
jgi:hypothetical protein